MTIQELAAEIAKKCHQEILNIIGKYKPAMNDFGAIQTSVDNAIATIREQAMKEQREKDAKIVESFSDNWNPEGKLTSACYAIATAIRKEE